VHPSQTQQCLWQWSEIAYTAEIVCHKQAYNGWRCPAIILLNGAHLQSFQRSREAIKCAVSVLSSMPRHMLAATPRMVYARPLAQLPHAGQRLQSFSTSVTRTATAPPQVQASSNHASTIARWQAYQVVCAWPSLQHAVSKAVQCLAQLQARLVSYLIVITSLGNVVQNVTRHDKKIWHHDVL